MTNSGCDFRVLTATGVCLLWCSGCLLAPIPTPEHNNDELPGRTNITSEMVEKLQPGITTREAILMQLGVPEGDVSPGAAASHDPTLSEQRGEGCCCDILIGMKAALIALMALLAGGAGTLKQGDSFEVGGKKGVVSKIDALPVVENEFSRRF